MARGGAIPAAGPIITLVTAYSWGQWFWSDRGSQVCAARHDAQFYNWSAHTVDIRNSLYFIRPFTA
jgi:hypothetical protein